MRMIHDLKVGDRIMCLYSCVSSSPTTSYSITAGNVYTVICSLSDNGDDLVRVVDDTGDPHHFTVASFRCLSEVEMMMHDILTSEEYIL